MDVIWVDMYRSESQAVCQIINISVGLERKISIAKGQTSANHKYNSYVTVFLIKLAKGQNKDLYKYKKVMKFPIKWHKMFIKRNLRTNLI